MCSTRHRPRWSVWLLTAAAGAALLMVALAWLTAQSVAARHGLALDGRVLGLAHAAERELREIGLTSSTSTLEQLVASSSGEVRGLRLADADGRELVSVGRCDPEAQQRTVDLFLGRFAAEGVSGPGGWRHGRGRFSLEVFLDPTAGRPPVAARLVLPAAILVGVSLVGLALWSGRLLEQQRQLEVEMIDQRRLEGLARAGAGLAHQLRTPLATIKGSCQLVQEQAPDGPWERRLETAVSEAERMERTLSLLLDFARPPRPEPADVDLVQALEQLAEHRQALTVVASDPVSARVDPDHLEQLIANLVENALQASPADGTVTMTARRDGDRAVIEIADRGPGPGDDPGELFEPYVTGRADGTGLGLPIARMLAEVNQGEVILHSRPGGGCVARVALPATGGQT